MTRFAKHYAPDVEVEFRRVAVTPEQIAEHRLPTQPVKENASRKVSFKSDRTVQLEALPPDVIAEILYEAIVAELDEFDAVLEREEDERTDLQEWLGVEDHDDPDDGNDGDDGDPVVGEQADAPAPPVTRVRMQRDEADES